jgi:DNA-binding response OmpR family regulator
VSDPRILVVDDDPGIVDVVSYALRGDGFEVDSVETGEDALRSAEDHEYDLVVLDLMLPGLSGTEVCRRLRENEQTVPIVMLTAKDAELDRVLGLELGADDYVVKPFSPRELVSRVRAIFRRQELERQSREGPVRVVGPVEIDLARHEVKVDERLVRLTPSEFKVLALLAAKPDRVFSRREILQHLWSSTHVGDEHACDVHISNLRRKIEADQEQPRYLVTVRGAGYKLAAGK